MRSTSEVRYTAVPLTRRYCRSASSLANSLRGGDSRLVLAASSRVPRTQVYITANMPAPNSTGTKPPSRMRIRLALRNTTSSATSGAATAMAAISGHFHSFHMTMKARDVVTAMVPETAMP